MTGLTLLARFPRKLDYSYGSIDSSVSLAIANAQVERRPFTALFLSTGEIA